MLSAQVHSLRDDFAQAREAAELLHRSGAPVTDVIRSFTSAVDEILKRLYHQSLGSAANEVALLAVGGYGRRELCPQSDIDILFLVRAKAAPPAGVAAMVRDLWDTNVQLGHAVRTPRECLAFMRDDLTTANALLEARLLVGSDGLFSSFLDQSLEPYLARRRRAFVESKIDIIRRSIEDPDRTIYMVEPNLKDGVCGLRDIQRVIWIEAALADDRVTDPFELLALRGPYSRPDVTALREAYEFFLRVRVELHFTHKLRLDVLERDSILTVARRLGYGEGAAEDALHTAGEALLRDYYRHARRTLHFLKLYVETLSRPPGALRRLHRWWMSEAVDPLLTVYQGCLHLAPGAPAEPDGQALLGIFEAAQDRNARMSEFLCEWIRQRVAALDADLSHDANVLLTFRKILRGPQVGRILRLMHATRVLDRILPEFAAIDCLVNFDGHHKFTVDEHTLRTLAELDAIEASIEAGTPYPEREFQRLYGEIRDPVPLRVAMLLHDIGKAIPGDHSVSGAETATLIARKLGLENRVVEGIDFLIYRHLELFRASQYRDISEDHVLLELAKLVESEERLKSLYLLTYVDIVSVGPGTWTRWKGAQLAEVYTRTLEQLRRKGPAPSSPEVAIARSSLQPEERKQVLDHLARVETPSYARDNVPERMLAHVHLVEALKGTGLMQVALEPSMGYLDVTFCSPDRSGLFADYAGLLYSEGLDVLAARIYSRSDGVTIDTFQVEASDPGTLQLEEKAERLRRKMRRLEAHETTVEDLVLQRSRSLSLGYKRPKKPLVGPSVTVDNESSLQATVVAVSAGDRPGLLYDLAHCLHELKLNVRTALVSTLTDRARDVFYVLEEGGGKVENSARRAEVVQALLASARGKS